MRLRSGALVRRRHAMVACTSDEWRLWLGKYSWSSSRPRVRNTRNTWTDCTVEVLSNPEIILDVDAQHLQKTAACYPRHRCRFNSGRSVVSSSPVVSDDDLGRLAVVQLEIVLLGPFLHFRELCMPCYLVAGQDDDVRIVSVLAHWVSWCSGDYVSGGVDVCG